MPDTALLNTAQLLTLSGPNLGIIPNGALLIRDTRILAAAPQSEIEPHLRPHTHIIDAQNRTVLPGFIDAHTHALFAGTRAHEFERRSQGATYADIAAEGGGILSTVRATRTTPDLLPQATRYIPWFLAGGTTTIEVKSGYGLNLETELRILKTIPQLPKLRTIPTFLGAHETPDEFRAHPEAYLQYLIQEVLPKAAPLAEYADIFCEQGVFTPDQARPYLQAAKSHGLGLRIHADQFTPDYASLLAAELQATTADHLECTTEKGIDALAKAGVQPVLLPGSVYALGRTSYPNARLMLDRGLAPVLATDFNPGSSPTASMPMILSLACTHLHMTPAEAITAATINAARSLNRTHDLGSLEPGKLADFVIHDCEDYRELAYFFGRDTARAVYIGGECVYP